MAKNKIKTHKASAKKFMVRTTAGVSVFFIIYVVLSVFGSMNNSSGIVECIKNNLY